MPSFYKDHLTAGLCVVPLFQKIYECLYFPKICRTSSIMYHAFLPFRSPTFCHIFRVPGGVRQPSFVFIRQRIRAPGRSPCIIIRQKKVPHRSPYLYQRPPASSPPANIKQIARVACKYHRLKRDT